MVKIMVVGQEAKEVMEVLEFEEYYFNKIQ